jgi:KUP system potassium uptake protein
VKRPRLLGLALCAVGVVFGDIGTSPLYTLQVAAQTSPGHALDRADVFGVVSLIVWALTLAVSIKYVGFVMRADNRGEGGILALLSLLPQKQKRDGASVGVIGVLVLAGAALLFGDGMITPAISVLSALEGLEVAAPGLRPLVLPMTCAVLIGLFALQRRGTGAVGQLFGPVMVLWFLAVGALGFRQIVLYPAILRALSPSWAGLYFVHHGFAGLAILGVVVLAITGGEALYADMGAFGAPAVRFSWFTLVFPALTLGYLGQGALLVRDPSALDHPFFSMCPPGPLSFALVVLAALATAIASQALISGVFALTHQAVQLGFFPRVTIRYTSHESEGQTYVPFMNWALMVACIALVLGFQQADRLASAYGVAVSGTMTITSVVFFEVTRKTWRWPPAASVAVLVLFLSFDIPFLAANLTKIVQGGYIPIVVGAIFFVVMLDWHAGRHYVREYRAEHGRSLEDFRRLLASPNMARVPGTAIYLTSTAGPPHMLAMQAKRMRSVMQKLVLLRVVTEHQPRVDDERRHSVQPFDSQGIASVTLRFGFLETPNVPSALDAALPHCGPGASLDDATYYVERETFLVGKGGRMGRISEGLFSLLSRNARSAIDHFGLPPDQVIELGTRIDL